MNALLQLASAFYSEADAYRATVEKIIETVHSHTFKWNWQHQTSGKWNLNSRPVINKTSGGKSIFP